MIGSFRVASLVRRSAVLGCAATLLAIGVQSAGAAPPTGSWSFAGNDATNSRTQSAETTISSSNVGQLAVKWTAPTHGDVSATPTVANGVVYFPDWGGYINAVNAQTGALIWQKQLSADYGYPASFLSNWISRTSPAIYKNEVIFGDNNGTGYLNGGVGANVLAVDAQTGQLLWKTKVDTDPAAVLTANPVVGGGKLIVGVSSNEEGVASGLYGPYQCCTFRGKVVALNPNTGAIEWSTYTVPTSSFAGDSNLPCTGSAQTGDDNPTGCDYTGGAVWDTPAVDNGMVFIGAGNNYTAPDSAVACEQAAQQNNTSDANCTASNDYFDSVLALNIGNGKVVWGHKVEGWDAWTVACFFLPPGVTWCPSPLSPDYDFGGSGPNVITGPKGTKLVGAGQKSGVYWAFDEKTGATVWNTLVGPGAALGGIEWGTAYDGQRIYVPIANSNGIPYTLADGHTSTNGGSWAALDPLTGKFDWQVATPGSAMGIGPASAANGVVFVGSSAGGGSNNMFALDAATGNVLWSFPASGSVWSGPAIVDGVVYWGSGYGRFAYPNTGNKFYAFSINGH